MSLALCDEKETVAVERGTSNTHSVSETALSTKINGTKITIEVTVTK